MEKQTSPAIPKKTGWKVFLGFNSIILFLFWCLVLTDYSWYANWVSFLYSVFVLCICVVTFFMLNFGNILQRVLVLGICLVSFLAALAAIPMHRYHSDETPVAVEVSPDHQRFIEVYCSFTPAHATGFDHIEISMRSKGMPFLQRDLGLYNNYAPRHCDADLDPFVRWEDNNTIYITEKQAYLDVDHIHWEPGIVDPGEIDRND